MGKSPAPPILRRAFLEGAKSAKSDANTEEMCAELLDRAMIYKSALERARNVLPEKDYTSRPTKTHNNNQISKPVYNKIGTISVNAMKHNRKPVHPLKPEKKQDSSLYFWLLILACLPIFGIILYVGIAHYYILAKQWSVRTAYRPAY